MLYKQQQQNGPEHRERDSSDIAVVKSKVNVYHCNQEVRDGFSKERYPVKDCILDEGTKFGICSRHDCCSGTLRLLWVLSWFPGFLWVPPAPGPRCLCSPVGFAPNLLIPEFIENSAQQQLVQVSRPFLP